MSAQPANDNCNGAFPLAVNGSCIPTTGDVAGATLSMPAITCGFTGTANDDVWYRFTATSTVATIKVTGSASFDAVVDLRIGPCNGIGIACADATGYGGTEAINATACHQPSLVRVMTMGRGPRDHDLDICVFVPANDFAVAPSSGGLQQLYPHHGRRHRCHRVHSSAHMQRQHGHCER